jgi:NADH-quinone oxidoreductase subunit H
VSGLASLLFLGGWHAGFLPQDAADPGMLGFWLGNLLNLLVFVGKCWLLVLVMMWMRWSLPRLRIDQVMETCLQYFLPISCVLLVGVCIWQLTVPVLVSSILKYILTFGSLGFMVVVIGSLFRGTLQAPRGQLPGAWDNRTAGALAPQSSLPAGK